MGSTGRLCKEECLEIVLKGINGGGESCIKSEISPDCGCKVAEGSFAKFSGEPWTIKKKLLDDKDLGLEDKDKDLRSEDKDKDL